MGIAILLVWLVELIYLIVVLRLAFYVARQYFDSRVDGAEQTFAKFRLLWSLLAFAALTWPFLLGRLVFEIDCRAFGGFWLEKPIDARSSGYLIQSQSQRSPYRRAAAYDLLRGRISFFEVANGQDSEEVGYTKYSLAWAGGTAGCYERASEIISQSELPSGQCLAVTQTAFSASSYEVIGYGASPHDDGDSPRSVRVVDRKTGKTVSSARAVVLPYGKVTMVGMEALVCSANSTPIAAITAATFIDRDGRAISPDAFKAMTLRHEHYPPLPFAVERSQRD